jgi:hypothetical protein
MKKHQKNLQQSKHEYKVIKPFVTDVILRHFFYNPWAEVKTWFMPGSNKKAGPKEIRGRLQEF